MRRRTERLETVFVVVPEHAVPAYEAAMQQACSTVGEFLVDEDTKIWRVEGVKALGENEEALSTALMLAELATATPATLEREATEAEGWLARVYSAFPEQLIGKRFAVRGTHVAERTGYGRVVLTIDAGLAFGSGEHGSTRGCLRALERVAYRRPRHIVDMGCGSGILAMAACKLLQRPVLGIDNDPWSVRVAAENAALNGVRGRMVGRLGNGWYAQAARANAPYDLIFANILARPLCLMARQLAHHLAKDGTVILAGLLHTQMRAVLAAHRRQGLRLEATLREGNWTTMVLRK